MKDAVSGKAGDILRSPVTAKRVSDAEDWWISKRYSARLEDGTLRGVQIVVHRGFVADGEVRVHLRVVEAPQLPKEVDEQSSNYLRICICDDTGKHTDALPCPLHQEEDHMKISDFHHYQRKMKIFDFHHYQRKMKNWAFGPIFIMLQMIFFRPRFSS